VADTCDRCGEKLFQREDDRRDSVKVRLETYEESTALLIWFYKRLGILVTIAASGPPKEICEHTITALEDFRKRNSARERT
jgi:adenylate kinase